MGATCSSSSPTAPAGELVAESPQRDQDEHAPPPGEVELAAAPPARAASVGAAALAKRLKKLKSRREIEREIEREFED